jgi:hypothetical protein
VLIGAAAPWRAWQPEPDLESRSPQRLADDQLAEEFEEVFGSEVQIVAHEQHRQNEDRRQYEADTGFLPGR